MGIDGGGGYDFHAWMFGRGGSRRHGWILGRKNISFLLVAIHAHASISSRCHLSYEGRPRN
eukprot:5517299-Pyramimonas_sp.AAC.1